MRLGSRTAAALEQPARDAGKDAADAALDAERVRRAPVTVAVGGALANWLNAAHLLGYAGKMLSGRKARSARPQQAFCGPGETLVGWVSLGTAARVPGPRRPKGRRVGRVRRLGLTRPIPRPGFRLGMSRVYTAAGPAAPALP